MTSPARRHLLRQSAIEAAQQDTSLLRHATGYELLLQKLNADQKALKKAYSAEKKAELKRKMLPEYAPWVAGVLAEGKGAQDAILMTIMIWRIDAGDYAGALEIARYALHYKLAMPFGKPPPPVWHLSLILKAAACRPTSVARASGQTASGIRRA